MSEHQDVEVFNAAAFHEDPAVGEVMVSMSPQISRFLAGIGEQPRGEDWLAAELDATPDRLRRLQTAGFVRRSVGAIWPRRWYRTAKGDAWHRVWADEMARRRRSAARGPMWLEGEEPQDGDQVIIATEIQSNIALPGGGVLPGRALPNGMNSALRIVPHDPVARDLPWKPPADMVEALGLLDANGGEPVSVNYLVGACVSETSAARIGQILGMLQSMGLAVPRGHGWVRTLRGGRMHETWLMEAEKRAKKS